jgi:hypothetical protein
LKNLDLRLDHVRRFLDGGDLFGTFLIEGDFELLFERHHDFDGVERVGAEVDKLGVGGDGVEIRAELLRDDGANLVEGVLGLREGINKKTNGLVSLKTSNRIDQSSPFCFDERLNKAFETKQSRKITTRANPVGWIETDCRMGKQYHCYPNVFKKERHE